MKKTVVSWSNIRNVSWENKVMEIKFNDGSTFQYHNVSKSDYQNFRNSSSPDIELARLDKTHRRT